MITKPFTPSLTPKTPTARAYSQAVDAITLLKDAGFEAVLVGGGVRDLLLDRTPKDFDIATNATPDQVVNISGFTRASFQDTSQAYGVTRVCLSDKKGEDIEIATFRKDLHADRGRKETEVEFTTLAEDIARRDLTINGLAYDPQQKIIIDYCEGLADIDQRRIKFIGDPAQRLKEDPLRLLRAIRFRNSLDFRYDDDTYAALQTAVADGLCETIATDRTRLELTRMITHEDRMMALGDLDRLGVIARLFPDITAMHDVDQPNNLHEEGDVWQHTLLTMHYLPIAPSPRLAWAALLHDIGKPPTFESRENTGDRIRFNDHAAVGADIARKIGNQLQFSKAIIRDIVWLVDNHMRIHGLPKMREGRQRFFMSHPAFGDLLELYKADSHAAWHVDNQGNLDTSEPDMSILNQLYGQYEEARKHPPPSLKRDLGIDGQYLMKEYGLPGDAGLKKLLTLLEDAYLDSEITDINQARDLIEITLNKGT